LSTKTPSRSGTQCLGALPHRIERDSGAHAPLLSTRRD
jgi:hypothetical protein